MSEQTRQLSFQSVNTMDNNYPPSSVSTTPSSPLDHSPLSNSPLSTPEDTDLEDAPHFTLGSGSSDPTFVLVVGGLGFIGSHTTLELLRAGYNGM